MTTAAGIQSQLEDFGAIAKPNASLAPYTLLKIGGPAEMLVEPTSIEQLSAVVRRCAERSIPLRVLGSGCNILMRDEVIRGVVLRLSAPAFTQITVQGRRVRAGCGATLAALISEAVRHGLAGLESLVGTPGTVGGALRHSGDDQSGEIGQYVRLVEVLDASGTLQTHDRDDLRFSYRTSSLDDPVLLAAEFELETDAPDALVKRLRKAWIQRKAGQPFSFQASGRIFRNPRGLSAAALIEQAGLVGTRVGGAQVSDRHPNYIVAEPGTSARDVLRLIDLVRSRVEERFHVEMELEISIW